MKLPEGALKTISDLRFVPRVGPMGIDMWKAFEQYQTISFERNGDVEGNKLLIWLIKPFFSTGVNDWLIVAKWLCKDESNDLPASLSVEEYDAFRNFIVQIEKGFGDNNA